MSPPRYIDDDYEDLREDYDFDLNYVQWGSSDGIHFTPSTKTVRRLPPAVYEVAHDPQLGLHFEKIPVKTEGLIKFPGTKSSKVVAEIQSFWERESLFAEYNLTYKRGIMLFGPPGSGKSCTIQLIMQDVVKRGGIVVLFTNPLLFIDGLRNLRKIQPKTPIVTIMEDFDALMERFNESEILNILDGVHEVHKVVFLATTNYPDKLGPRVMNRPSRFDKRFRIGFPSAVSRKLYFEVLIGKENIPKLNIDLDRWVKDTDRMSIAHLKELFVAVTILGDKYEDAVKTLKKMKEGVDDRDVNSGMGFMSDENEELYD